LERIDASNFAQQAPESLGQSQACALKAVVASPQFDAVQQTNGIAAVRAFSY
jgi:hypothetical protein